MPRFIDLTLTLRPGMRGVSFETACTIEQDGWNAATLHLYSHAGTHMDAASHYEVNEETIDQIPLERCMVQAWVVDATGVPPRGIISVAHLGSIAERLARGEGLLLRTDWSRYLGRPEYREALPRVGRDLAAWCAKRGVGLLGVEPPAVADVSDREEITEVHRILLGAGIVIVEGLTNLDKITQDRVTFAAFPLKIGGGDGAPVRALAIEETA